MGEQVVFYGATDAQVKFGNCDDPRGVLVVGQSYDVDAREVHSWHTRVKLSGVPGWFNSVVFEP